MQLFLSTMSTKTFKLPGVNTWAFLLQERKRTAAMDGAVQARGAKRQRAVAHVHAPVASRPAAVGVHVPAQLSSPQGPAAGLGHAAAAAALGATLPAVRTLPAAATAAACHAAPQLVEQVPPRVVSDAAQAGPGLKLVNGAYAMDVGGVPAALADAEPEGGMQRAGAPDAVAAAAQAAPAVGTAHGPAERAAVAGSSTPGYASGADTACARSASPTRAADQPAVQVAGRAEAPSAQAAGCVEVMERSHAVPMRSAPGASLTRSSAHSTATSMGAAVTENAAPLRASQAWRPASYAHADGRAGPDAVSQQPGPAGRGAGGAGQRPLSGGRSRARSQTGTAGGRGSPGLMRPPPPRPPAARTGALSCPPLFCKPGQRPVAEARDPPEKPPPPAGSAAAPSVAPKAARSPVRPALAELRLSGNGSGATHLPAQGLLADADQAPLLSAMQAMGSNLAATGIVSANITGSGFGALPAAGRGLGASRAGAGQEGDLGRDLLPILGVAAGAPPPRISALPAAAALARECSLHGCLAQPLPPLRSPAALGQAAGEPALMCPCLTAFRHAVSRAFDKCYQLLLC